MPRKARRKDPRTERYQIRHTPADRRAWERAAKAKGLDLSDFIRVCMAEALHAHVSSQPSAVSDVVIDYAPTNGAQPPGH